MFLDFPSSLVVDEEMQERQYDEGGEEGEKQEGQGAGVEQEQELQKGEGGEDGEKQEGQGGTRSEKCAGRKNASPLESKATQGESEGSIVQQGRSEGVRMRG